MSPHPPTSNAAPVVSPAAAKPDGMSRRCRRCDEPVTRDEHEPFFKRTGLCFWCAYVDPQG